MDFRFSPEDEAFRQEIKEFLSRELPEDWEERHAGRPLDGWLFYRGFIKKLAERGWTTLGWPSEWGGQGASYIRQLVFNEGMAYSDAPAIDLGVDRVGPTIMLYGTDEQKRRFLPSIVSGDAVWCQGFSEPGAGSDLASLETKAVRDGDSYVVNGTKMWTSFAHMAERMILLARTDPAAPKHKGISYFLLDMKSPGVTVQPLVDMMGRHFFNQVFFDNVRVPREDLVGEENRGWYIGTTTLDFERSGIARVMGGLRTYRRLVKYCCEPQSDGQRLIARGDVRHKLAELKIEFEVGRLLSYRVAWLQAQNMVPNHEASVAKLYGSELAVRLANVGMEIAGLGGQLDSHSRFAPLGGRIKNAYLNTASLTIAAGTSEVQRNIIAGRGLGLPRD